ncbi:DUF1275 domain-containing protein [Streptomyces sp. NBC_01551]|uniref:YoaK family protein n=1 Tax=Streptomyces sp. NBC_01551 TaxID=2975876 RepID=UPI002251AAD9|nr:YoaK family protein [Streptomyces sp. NBC_01551]MCX4529373.1 DUF1275 domain-containing protein [Streptomyces sp. NBC_01551]
MVAERAERTRLAALMLVLTTATGMIEAVSLLALGPVFTAMQTGNVLYLAFGAAVEGNLPALAPAVSLASFAAGAVCAARLESATEARGRRWFVIGLLVEGTLILAAAGAGWGVAPHYGSPTVRHLAVAAILAVAMGFRNVTSMRVNLPGVPTTLVTRSMTAFFGVRRWDRTARSGTARRRGSCGRWRCWRCSRAGWRGPCWCGPGGR